MTDPIHPDLFQQIIVQVEDEGGAMLPDACDPQKLTVKTPSGMGMITTVGCRGMSRMIVPYKVYHNSHVSRGGGFLTVCANCDRVDLWPRFQTKEGTS